MYARGNRRDYDALAAKGNAGWDYGSSVLPYFKKAENMTNPALATSKYHGTGGPLTVSINDHKDDSVATAVKNTSQDSLDLPDKVDCNGENQVGSSFIPMNVKDGQRDSTHRAYLEPVLSRKNLYVRTHSQVIRILVYRDTRRANGVKFVHKNVKTAVFASKEVIVCAGAIRSPHHLMLSGLGPRDHLRAVGIDVIEDIPVRNNLRDHVVMNPIFPLYIDGSQAKESGSIARIPRTPSGPFHNVIFMTAFKSFRSGNPSWPDAQYVVSKVLDLDGCWRTNNSSP